MIVRFALAIVPLLLASLCANAQDTATPASASQAANAAINGPKQDEHTATMDTIQVTAKRPDTVDLYKFKNPIDPKTTEFSKDYHEPPSPQEISENGGILPYAVGYLLGKLGDAAKSIPGWKTNQARNAHPPPLTDAQLQRATQLQQQGQSAAQNAASTASGSAPAQ